MTKTKPLYCIFVLLVMVNRLCVVGSLDIGLRLQETVCLNSTMSSSLVDTDGIVNEATIIVRNDNPNMVRLINAFSETAQLLSHKPDRATD